VSFLKEFLEISPLSPCNDTLEATSFSGSYYVFFLKKPNHPFIIWRKHFSLLFILALRFLYFFNEEVRDFTLGLITIVLIVISKINFFV
jgi:hypothetical protein